MLCCAPPERSEPAPPERFAPPADWESVSPLAFERQVEALALRAGVLDAADLALLERALELLATQNLEPGHRDASEQRLREALDGIREGG